MATSKSNAIAVTGPESTGKTWLCQQISAQQGCTWVPEFARNHLPQLQHPITVNDVLYIAEHQHQQVLQAMAQNSLVLADTELINCIIWCEEVFQHCPEQLYQMAQNQPYSMYWVCTPEVPWEDDGMRANPHNRWYLYHRYVHYVQQWQLPYAIISGNDYARRLAQGLHYLSI